MRTLHTVLFAKTLPECEGAFPKNDTGAPCLNKLRSLMARFTVVGKRPALSGSGLVDVGRTVVVKGLTEQMEYITSLSGEADLGPLGGTPPPVPRSTRKLTQRQRDAFSALNQLLGDDDSLHLIGTLAYQQQRCVTVQALNRKLP